MKRRGFTLIEGMCAIAIMVSLASILLPVFGQARHSARATSALSNLHQLHIGMKLYQSAYDGEGKYGFASEMGLPDAVRLYSQAPELFPELANLWRSPCGQHPDQPFSANSRVNLTYYASDLVDESWRDYAMKWEEESMLLIDQNCADHSLGLYSEFTKKRLMGVRLSGTLSRIQTAETILLWPWHLSPNGGNK